MSVVKECTIEFKDGQTTYAPGSKVFGRILMQLTEKILGGRIELTFHGSAQVHWSENEELSDHKIIVNKYAKDIVYFNEKQTAWIFIEDDRELACRRVYRKSQLRELRNDSVWIHSRLEDDASKGLFGSVESKVGGRARVKLDTLSFDFSFQLPSNLPNSFHSKQSPASVGYYVEVSLAGFFHDVKARRAYLTVFNESDVSNVPSALEPVEKQMTYKFMQGTSLARKLSISGEDSGEAAAGNSIVAYASLPQRYFSPGERIPVSVELVNDSGKLVKAVRVQLVQTVVCESESPQRRTRETEEVVAEALRTIEKQQHQQQRKESLLVGSTITEAGPEEPSMGPPLPRPVALRQLSMSDGESAFNAKRLPRRSISMTTEENQAPPVAAPAALNQRRRSSITKWISTRVRRISGSHSGAAGAEDVDEILELFIPQLVPNLTVEGVLSVSYLLRVQAFLFRDQPPSIQLDIPVVIGTKPVKPVSPIPVSPSSVEQKLVFPVSEQEKPDLTVPESEHNGDYCKTANGQYRFEVTSL